MKEVRLVDDGGDAVVGIEHNGCYFPNFPDTRGIEGLKHVSVRHDDVIICTFPKSGTHWLYEITRQLVSGEITCDSYSMGSTFMDRQPEEAYADLPAPRILSSHALMEQLPVDVLKKKIKIIHVLRNPKDIAVSLYKFMQAVPFIMYRGKWENYLRPFVSGKLLYGSWFDYIWSWEAVKKNHPDQPIVTFSFEDFKQDQIREMRKLCQFLGVERNEEFLSRLCQHTTIDNMRTQNTNVMKCVFRKGEVGGWKNWFTVAQNEWFDQLYQEKMKNYPLKITFTGKSIKQAGYQWVRLQVVWVADQLW